jgi:hypothetical protein
MSRNYDEYDDEDRGPRRRGGGGASIPNYLVQSILVTLCCCLPFGIVAIINAVQVNNKIAAGDIEGARRASDQAKMWCWIGFGIGIVANIIGAIIQVVMLSNQPGGARFR